MKKNLAVIHLETISHFAFWQHQTELTALWDLKNQSMYFTKCYSSTPMTALTMFGISLGATGVLDAYSHYNREDAASSGEEALFSILEKELGYKTAVALASEVNDHFFQTVAMKQLLGSEQSYFLKGVEWDETELKAYLAEAKQENRGFAFYLYNYIDAGHVTMNIDSWRRYASMDMAEMQKDIMRKADASVHRFVSLLTRMKLLEDTIIVVFGDHGWGVARDRFGEPVCSAGVTVSVEQTRIPLFFYNSPLGIGCTDKPAMPHDLRATILGMLCPERSFPKIDSPGAGIDLARERRDVVFAQNKAALQNPRARKHESKKSYAAMDGNYRLIVSETNEEKTEGGLEMYFEAFDHGQNMDLLRLFTYDDEANITGLDCELPQYEGLIGYPLLNNPLRFMELARIYGQLRSNLMLYVSQKEEAALRFSPENEFLFNKASFNVVASKRGKAHSVSTPSKFDENIRELIRKNDQIALFGAGGNGKQVWAIFEFYGLTPICFIDNAVSSFNMSDNSGITVLAPGEARRRYPSSVVVICSPYHRVDREMAEQCRELGLEHLSFFKDLLQMPLSYD